MSIKYLLRAWASWVKASQTLRLHGTHAHMCTTMRVLRHHCEDWSMNTQAVLVCCMDI